jgi:23S rRNA (adenine2030-N6)-methyltransferase
VEGVPEPQRTGEWRVGIARVMARDDAALADYRAQVAAVGFPARYPGSPMLIRAVLRDHDRLTLCELHPEDHPALRARFSRDAQVGVHRRDAYEAVLSLTPFPERRGLILLDPPYERDDEYGKVTDAIATLRHRFRAGIVAAWYPIKHRAPVRAFHDALRAASVPDCVAAELTLREPTDPARLNGCGLLIANPPFGFDDDARAILDALLACLSRGDTGAGATLSRVTEER